MKRPPTLEDLLVAALIATFRALIYVARTALLGIAEIATILDPDPT